MNLFAGTADLGSALRPEQVVLSVPAARLEAGSCRPVDTTLQYLAARAAHAPAGFYALQWGSILTAWRSERRVVSVSDRRRGCSSSVAGQPSHKVL